MIAGIAGGGRKEKMSQRQCDRPLEILEAFSTSLAAIWQEAHLDWVAAARLRAEMTGNSASKCSLQLYVN
jgi:hypothetical protein